MIFAKLCILLSIYRPQVLKRNQSPSLMQGKLIQIKGTNPFKSFAVKNSEGKRELEVVVRSCIAGVITQVGSINLFLSLQGNIITRVNY